MIPIGICTDFDNLPEVLSLGFDYVEVPLDELAALSDHFFQEFAAWCEGSGIRVTAVNRMLPKDLPIVGENVHASELHDYLKKAFERARRLKVRVVTMDAPASRMVPDGFDYAMAWRQFGNFLRLAQGHARECGLVIAVEPIRRTECNLLNLVSEATLISGLLQLGNVGVAANSGHMGMASESIGTLAQAGAALWHVHVENTLTRRMPAAGDGEDYRRLMNALRSIGYTGGVSACCAKAGEFSVDAYAALLCLRRAQETF